MDMPFRGGEAIARGRLTRHELRAHHQRVFHDVYVAKDTAMTALLRAQAAWLSTGATLAGVSAAAVLGTKWLDDNAHAEIVRADRHAQPGMVARSYGLGDGDECVVRGIRITTAARTAFDIGRTRALDQSVPMLDALVSATNVAVTDIEALADRCPGFRGVRTLRSALALVDGGSESPRETAVRLLLVRARLPRPETQIELRDLHIRLDMGWREYKVAVEYDGVQHWSDSRQRSWDIDRLALLEAAGWIVIRVSAEMLRRPQVIVDRVRAALAQRGWYAQNSGDFRA